MTVEQYFRADKNINLKFPNLPLLHVGPPQKTIYVPMEVRYQFSVILLLLFQELKLKKLQKEKKLH